LIAERLASKPARSCLWCSGPIAARQRIDAVYCSADCNYAAHRPIRNIRRRLGSRATSRRRLAPALTLIDIAWQSCWRCGICGRRVRPSLAHPEPMAPSIDHRLALARGGDSDPANLQLAHLICNLRKRAEAA
jgi:hypothetical protein